MGYEKSKATAKRDKRTGGTDKRQGTIDWRDYSFVHLELSADERRELREGVVSFESITAWLDECLNAGYTAKCKCDSGRGTFHFTLSCDAPEEPNAGLRLSGYGHSISAAMLSVYYKDTVICGDRSWREAASERSGGLPDVG